MSHYYLMHSWTKEADPVLFRQGFRCRNCNKKVEGANIHKFPADPNDPLYEKCPAIYKEELLGVGDS